MHGKLIQENRLSVREFGGENKNKMFKIWRHQIVCKHTRENGKIYDNFRNRFPSQNQKKKNYYYFPLFWALWEIHIYFQIDNSFTTTYTWEKLYRTYEFIHMKIRKRQKKKKTKNRKKMLIWYYKSNLFTVKSILCLLISL